MEDISKRLVEAEYILKKLDDEYINKIPEDIWKYIEKNKDKDYVFNYDEKKTIAEQNLNMDTISILTYINMEYLLNKEQKQEMVKLLKKDEFIAEQEKNKRYNPNDIFKNKKENNKDENNKEEALVEVKNEKWYKRLFLYFKNILKI